MGVSSYLEFLTTLFGWILYEGIWAILVDTGIVFIPIITLVVGAVISSHRAGDDEGSAALQSLKKIEADLITVIGVVIFAAIPLLDVELSEMEYVKPPLTGDCTAETIRGTNTGTTYDRVLAEISGQTGGIPLWWAMVHLLSKAVTSGAVAAIPCTADLSSVEFQLANDNIENPGLRQELEEFTDDCYRKARSRLMRNGAAGLTATQLEDTGWLGSSYFQTEPGYYNTYYAQRPQALFPYNATRDAGFDGDAIAGGHPSCNEWWADPGKGVRIKTLDSVDHDLKNEMIYAPNNLISQSTDQALSITEREDVFLRKYLAVTRSSEALSNTMPLSVGYNVSSTENIANAFDDGIINGVNTFVREGFIGFGAPKDVLNGAIAALGAAVSAPQAIGEGLMIRQGAPMFQALALMVLVAILPLLLVFSQYKLSMIFTITIMFFGLHFLTFLWAVAFWMDNNLMALITDGGSLGVFEPLASPIQSGLIVWMQRFLYVIVPMIYFIALGWVGFRANDVGSQLSGFSNNAAAPGAAGANAAVSAATGGAKGAVKKAG